MIPVSGKRTMLRPWEAFSHTQELIISEFLMKIAAILLCCSFVNTYSIYIYRKKVIYLKEKPVANSLARSFVRHHSIAKVSVVPTWNILNKLQLRKLIIIPMCGSK